MQTRSKTNFNIRCAPQGNILVKACCTHPSTVPVSFVVFYLFGYLFDIEKLNRGIVENIGKTGKMWKSEEIRMDGRSYKIFLSP